MQRKQIAEMTAVGFEPTPLRTGALSQRLRPLGQTVLPPQEGLRQPHASARSPFLCHLPELQISRSLVQIRVCPC